MKKYLLSASAFLSIFALSQLQNKSFAYEFIDESIYSEIATNFFENQYDTNDIEYHNLEVEYIKDMKDYDNNVVAKVVGLNRDNQHDYVLLNIATTQIDEFSIGNEKFYNLINDEIYYSGFNSYSYRNNNFYNTNDGLFISNSEFESECSIITNKFNDFKSSTKRFSTDNSPMPIENKTWNNGFYDWSTIYSYNKENEYKNSCATYLKGVTWTGLSDSDLKFESQSTFNSYFGTNNSCGPTALTNMFIYFDYLQIRNDHYLVQALLNNDKYQTFNKFRELTGHTNDDGVNPQTYWGALTKYSTNQFYNYEIYEELYNFEDYKKCIINQMPILTSITLGKEGHAVLVVGVEEFKKTCEIKHNFMWWNWTTTETYYNKYLRVVDGWSTSNSSRFIDYSGYWDSVTGRGFKIYEQN